MRRAVLAIVTLALAASPAVPAFAKPNHDVAEQLVVGRAGTGLSIVDAATGQPVGAAPVSAGALPTGIQRFFAATTDGAGTRVTELGAAAGSTPIAVLDGAWRVPAIGLDPTPVGLSADGSTLVLVEDLASRQPGVTRMALVSTSAAGPARVISIPGDFDYDAVSADGSLVYVIEHLTGEPGAYQVRVVDISAGTLRDGAVADKRNLDEAMAGQPIAQVRRPDGLVFTLYRRSEHPFIHALDSNQGFAVCIDLPAVGTDDPIASLDWGLVVAPDRLLGGDALYAVNVDLGLAVLVDMVDLTVRRTATIGDAVANLTPSGVADGTQVVAAQAGPRAAVSVDGDLVFAAGAHGVAAIGTADLAVTSRLRTGVPVDAVVAGLSGGSVYDLASDGGRIAEIDMLSGNVMRIVPGADYVSLVGRLPGS